MSEQWKPVPHSVVIGEAIAGRSATVRKTLQSLASHNSANLLDMAELLYEAQQNNYCHTWGYPSLPEFAEKELSMKPRRAQYLSRIVLVYKAVGLARKDVEHVHISKLREIARLKPESSFFNQDTKTNEPLEDHIVKLFLDADELTLQKVKDEVARLLGQTGSDRRVVRSFSTTQSAWDNVIKPALELVRKKLGSEGRDDAGNAKEYADGVCIEVLCADWLADPNNEEALELPEEIEGLVAEPVMPIESIKEKPTPLPKEITI